MKLGLWGITLTLVIALACVDAFGFDKVYPDADLGELFVGKEIQSSYVRVETFGVAEALVPTRSGRWASREVVFNLHGSGVVVGPNHIFTVAHVVTPREVEVYERRYSSFVTEPSKVLTQIATIRDCGNVPVLTSVEHVDEERDIAVLQYEAWADLEPVPFEIAKGRHLLEEGDALVAVVHERDKASENPLAHDVKFVKGEVISVGASACGGVDSEKVLPLFSMADFTMSLPLLPGDSGSPIFAFHDGTPVLVGIGKAGMCDAVECYFYAGWIGKKGRFLDLE